mmetsp:Transcript_6674/g.14609  ORF Transcript_6674/g.14609 Transcript_6674/m.14609 type:complete len:281 (-) Transcript_6674:631-1473(-)
MPLSLSMISAAVVSWRRSWADSAWAAPYNSFKFLSLSRSRSNQPCLNRSSCCSSACSCMDGSCFISATMSLSYPSRTSSALKSAAFSAANCSRSACRSTLALCSSSCCSRKISRRALLMPLSCCVAGCGVNGAADLNGVAAFASTFSLSCSFLSNAKQSSFCFTSSSRSCASAALLLCSSLAASSRSVFCPSRSLRSSTPRFRSLCTSNAALSVVALRPSCRARIVMSLCSVSSARMPSTCAASASTRARLPSTSVSRWRIRAPHLNASACAAVALSRRI